MKFGETPLDKVKGWTLRWPLPAAAHFPRVFYSPESLARMKEAFPGLSDEVKKLLRSDMEAFAFLTGDQAQLKQAYTGHLASLRTSAYDFLDGGHNTMNTYTHRFQEILRGSARALDIALSCPNLTPEERERALAVVAFLAYKQSDPDYWPYRAYGGGPSNPNMMSIACSALATGSAMLAGHPQQRDWLELCRRLVSADIMSSISKDGAWLESPGYQGAGNTPINETVLILRNAGVVNLTADPVYGKRLQDVSTYFANLLTPPDPRFNGQRKPMALGDNTPFWNNHYAYIAHGGRDAFPTQAGNAIWAWQQMGQPIGSVGLMLLQEHVLDGSLQPVPISGKSVAIDGFGVMLRHGFDTPAESFLTYRHNDFGYGHYDEDQGSFSWFAKGMPLCTDWIDYSFQEAEYHNRVTYEQGEPAWLLAPLDQTVFTPEADYVRGHDADPMRWQRQLLFVKDAKNPGDATYLVVRDLIRTDAPTTWNVWTLAVHGSEKVEGNVAHFTGQYGVDLAITFTRPLAKPLTTLLKQHTTRSYITMKQDMTRVQASADKGGDYGVVLYPTRRGKDAEPTVRELPSGVVEVRWNDARRHLIFLFPDVREVTEAGITLKGRAAIAKIENGKTTLVPLECEIFTTK
ncbi:MAG: hypothetical protein BWY76_02676 [bacterium ADurb.Bin429]|nr:MAG: hypothetical protein BWY76_02676 [bacterium ADurb.Bin429]